MCRAPIIAKCIEISHQVVITPGNKNFCFYLWPTSRLASIHQPPRRAGNAQPRQARRASSIFYYGRVRCTPEGASFLACEVPQHRQHDECQERPTPYWPELRTSLSCE